MFAVSRRGLWKGARTVLYPKKQPCDSTALQYSSAKKAPLSHNRDSHLTLLQHSIAIYGRYQKKSTCSSKELPFRLLFCGRHQWKGVWGSSNPLRCSLTENMVTTTFWPVYSKTVWWSLACSNAVYEVRTSQLAQASERTRVTSWFSNAVLCWWCYPCNGNTNRWKRDKCCIAKFDHWEDSKVW